MTGSTKPHSPHRHVFLNNKMIHIFLIYLILPPHRSNHQFIMLLCSSTTSTIISVSSGVGIDVASAIGGFLCHSNEDIWSIYGGSSSGFILPSGIDVTPAYLEKQSKSVAVCNTEARGGASDNGHALEWGSSTMGSVQIQSAHTNRSCHYSAWMAWLIEWCYLFPSWSLHHTIGTVNKNAVSTPGRQRVGVTVSSARLKKSNRGVLVRCVCVCYVCVTQCGFLLPATTPPIPSAFSVSAW